MQRLGKKAEKAKRLAFKDPTRRARKSNCALLLLLPSFSPNTLTKPSSPTLPMATNHHGGYAQILLLLCNAYRLGNVFCSGSQFNTISSISSRYSSQKISPCNLCDQRSRKRFCHEKSGPTVSLSLLLPTNQKKRSSL